jgi:hypothetical protein
MRMRVDIRRSDHEKDGVLRPLDRFHNDVVSGFSRTYWWSPKGGHYSIVKAHYSVVEAHHSIVEAHHSIVKSAVVLATPDCVAPLTLV